MTGFSLDMSYTRFAFRSTSRAGSEGRSKIAMNSLIGSVGCTSSVSVYAYLRTGFHSAFHTLLQRRKRQQREQAFGCSFCLGKNRIENMNVLSFLVTVGFIGIEMIRYQMVIRQMVIRQMARCQIKWYRQAMIFAFASHYPALWVIFLQ